MDYRLDINQFISKFKIWPSLELWQQPWLQCKQSFDWQILMHTGLCYICHWTKIRIIFLFTKIFLIFTWSNNSPTVVLLSGFCISYHHHLGQRHSHPGHVEHQSILSWWVCGWQWTVCTGQSQNKTRHPLLSCQEHHLVLNILVHPRKCQKLKTINLLKSTWHLRQFKAWDTEIMAVKKVKAFNIILFCLSNNWLNFSTELYLYVKWLISGILENQIVIM